MKPRYLAGVFSSIISLFGVFLPWFVIPEMYSVNGIDLIWKYNIGAIAYLVIVILALMLLFTVQIKRVSFCIIVSIIGLYINGNIILSIKQNIPDSLEWIIGVGPSIVSLGFILSIVISIYIDIINNKEEREALHRKMREDYRREKELREIKEIRYKNSYVVSNKPKNKVHMKVIPQTYKNFEQNTNEHYDDFDIDLTIPEEEFEEYETEDFMTGDENMEDDTTDFVTEKRKESKTKKKKAVAKLCPDCGKKIPLNSKFCPYCGHVFKK